MSEMTAAYRMTTSYAMKALIVLHVLCYLALYQWNQFNGMIMVGAMTVAPQSQVEQQEQEQESNMSTTSTTDTMTLTALPHHTTRVIRSSMTVATTISTRTITIGTDDPEYQEYMGYLMEQYHGANGDDAIAFATPIIPIHSIGQQVVQQSEGQVVQAAEGQSVQQAVEQAAQEAERQAAQEAERQVVQVAQEAQGQQSVVRQPPTQNTEIIPRPSMVNIPIRLCVLLSYSLLYFCLFSDILAVHRCVRSSYSLLLSFVLLVSCNPLQCLCFLLYSSFLLSFPLPRPYSPLLSFVLLVSYSVLLCFLLPRSYSPLLCFLCLVSFTQRLLKF